MEFILPSELKDSLIKNILPKTKQQNKPSNGTAVLQPRKSTIAVVPGLIPESILSAEQYDIIAERISFNTIKNRVYYQPVTDTTAGILLYHYEHYWTAGWIPAKNSNANYLYGYAIAYRDTYATLDKLNHQIISLFEETEDQYKKVVKVKRSNYNVITRYITVDDIKNSKFTIRTADEQGEIQCVEMNTFNRAAYAGYSYKYTSPVSDFKISKLKIIGFDCPDLEDYSSKRYNYVNKINNFYESIRESIPHFKGDTHLFCRMCTPKVTDYFLSDIYRTDFYSLKSYIPYHEEFNFTFLKELANTFPERYSYFHYRSMFFLQKALPVLDTPYFRKLVNQLCTAADHTFNTASESDKVFDKIKDLITLFRSVAAIHIMYPNCPLDYIQSNFDVLLQTFDSRNFDSVCNDAGVYQKGIEWIQQYLPVSSFFNMMSKEYARTKEDTRPRMVGRNHEFAREFVDVLAMITKIYNAGMTIDPPARWRFKEFHDHIQSVAWKIENKNVDLPQVLFPEPIKVTHDNQTWTFFQPKDVHQLSDWGRHVRNCVGSSTYSDQIKKHKAFIVLCMIDQKPIFTVQLEAADSAFSALTVRQIKGLSNSALTSEQQSTYESVFSIALKFRTQQL